MIGRVSDSIRDISIQLHSPFVTALTGASAAGMLMLAEHVMLDLCNMKPNPWILGET